MYESAIIFGANSVVTGIFQPIFKTKQYLAQQHSLIGLGKFKLIYWSKLSYKNTEYIALVNTEKSLFNALINLAKTLLWKVT